MGQVKLVSDTWDYIANVEIREGKLDNPNENDLVFEGPVERGDSFLSAEGVIQCYRRSGNPDDLDSPLGEWRCNSKTISGVDSWSLR